METSMDSTAEFFERGVKRSRVQVRALALVSIPINLAAVAWGLSEPHPGAMHPMAAAGILGLLVFGGMLIASFLPHPGLAALREREKIVWFFGANRSGYVYKLMIGLEDGRLRSLPLPRDSAEEGVELLRAVAPGATSGFSAQLRVAFKRDPSSLRAG